MLHACLYTICFVFCYTSWHFYAFSITTLLTRHQVASSLFFAVFVFQKAAQEIFSELDETKAEPPIFTEASRRLKMRRRGLGASHTLGWRGPGPSHATRGVSRPGPPPDATLPPIYSSRREKPKHPINFPRNLLQAASINDVRSGGSRSSSWHPDTSQTYL
jgi:hypothetical protein